MTTPTTTSKHERAQLVAILHQYAGCAHEPRTAAQQLEAAPINPDCGLVGFVDLRDAHGDLYRYDRFENGEITVWREWDDPIELRLIAYRAHAEAPMRYFWAEDTQP